MSKLRLSAKRAPHCFYCYRPNPDGNLLCLAHSNRLQDGKGMGLKGRDEMGAICCQQCHDLIDGRTGKLTREQAQDMHCTAHIRTLAWWRKEGLV